MQQEGRSRLRLNVELKFFLMIFEFSVCSVRTVIINDFKLALRCLKCTHLATSGGWTLDDFWGLQ